MADEGVAMAACDEEEPSGGEVGGELSESRSGARVGGRDSVGERRKGSLEKIPELERPRPWEGPGGGGGDLRR